MREPFAPQGLRRALFLGNRSVTVVPRSGGKPPRLTHRADTLSLSLRRVRVGVAPTPKLLPYGLRLQPEHRTDRHEGEEPVGVVAKKPRLGLLCLPLDTVPPGHKLSLETRQGIFKYGPH